MYKVNGDFIHYVKILENVKDSRIFLLKKEIPA